MCYKVLANLWLPTTAHCSFCLQLPLGLPPFAADPSHDAESRFLLSPQRLSLHHFERLQSFIPREIDPESLFEGDVCTVPTLLAVDRNPTTGELLGFHETWAPDVGKTAKNSLSFLRKPGPPGEALRGNATNYPFWPGGMDEPSLEVMKAKGNEEEEVDFERDLLTVAPGMKAGMNFTKPAVTGEVVGVLSLANLQDYFDDFDSWEEEPAQMNKAVDAGKPMSVPPTPALVQGLEELQTEVMETAQVQTKEHEAMPSVGKVTPSVGEAKGDAVSVEEPPEQWAIPVDTSAPVVDFHQRVPKPAFTWPFELDSFQKQAILHLENHESVFVAAHTSAGKTVVAEYAVALSQHHMTRVVYTSPIKALSNQKFRDFKDTFGDVGLLTGDVQLHPEATCLIMTTEILRSMLYNGSDVIRDLEWVIFDEVHYINDAERGVVWEEVLIMLPDHVSFILLSATVPNTMEFADWVGRTKRKKIYVISTQKRPIPLEHHLYTGNSTKTQNELFQLLDSSGNFLTKGYYAAVEAKKERMSKRAQTFGARQPQAFGGPKQDKNVWLALIDMLRKRDQLPVVAFTLSRGRCDDSASTLTTLDLTSMQEKHKVRCFLKRCLSRLKGSDGKLPQVLVLSELLSRGIGVHHSGILPILKECVEMLFAHGLVKLLFATETFAMGVNMPARTVVFDSTRKHDGIAFRDLLPGEYVQMAGRAGRRGLDCTGTVIILCKSAVPEMSDLHKMMLGKPTKLESRFRLTYSMILNLLRVESLRVEDMMRRSFSEFHFRKDAKEKEKRVAHLVSQLSSAPAPETSGLLSDLPEYHAAITEYRTLHARFQRTIVDSAASAKVLSPGRVLIVVTTHHPCAPAVILQALSESSRAKTFMVLALSDTEVREKDSASNSHSEYDAPRLDELLGTMVFVPEGPCGHVVLKVKPEDIVMIVDHTFKISSERILDDWNKRQIPRFRQDPPGPSTVAVTQELLRLAEGGVQCFVPLNPIKSFQLKDVVAMEMAIRLRSLTDILPGFTCLHSPKLNTQFSRLACRSDLQTEIGSLRFLLSDRSLQLLPDYQQRIQVLRTLGYVDESGAVQLKGRVACELTNHELLLTELLFDGMLGPLSPAEAAALLSCFVFTQKTNVEPKMGENLTKGVDRLRKLAEHIAVVQRECGLAESVEDYVHQFKFGLIEVVFEWANGVPFEKIAKLTDVQEGIVVRCMQRLDEACRAVRKAARVVGDPGLYTKMEAASEALRRDIVFAASLYTH
uniref:superkiller complex protein 2 isoform X2 n=1 Tax=Myxine glutinosa TaxID=7769 RepID=UPI00358F66F8